MIQFRAILHVTLVLLSIQSNCHAQKRYRDAETKILNTLLDEARYDSRVRPAGANETDTENEPVIVTVNMHLRSIEELDDSKRQFSCQLTFRQQWKDDRLRFDDMNGQIKYINIREGLSKIWTPDTFFRNEKQAHFHNMLNPNVLIRLHPDGSVFYSTRISATFSCPINLKNYPLDTQVCTIAVTSYGYTTEDIKYIWKKPNPVQVTANMYRPMFQLTQHKTGDCSSRTNTGEYSCAKVDFTFKRSFNYYLIQLYIPCTMMVIVSWIAFWIVSPKDTTARVFISLMTLLVMACMISFVNARMPAVSYTRAIDVFTGVSLTFVFVALLETATVNYLAKHRNDPEDARPRNYKMLQGMQTVHLDVISRIAFPISFVIFLFTYMAWILINS